MTRSDFKSDRHAALDANYPSEPRYCACKQGREGRCTCEPEPESHGLWIAFWLAVALVSGAAALSAAGVLPV